MKIKILTVFLVMVLAVAAHGIQTVVSVGPEENLGSGRLSNVAVDSSGRPVVAADGGANCYVYWKDSSGAWKSVVVNTVNYFSKQFYNPYVDLDAAGGIWVSGIMMPLTSGTSTNGKYVPKDAGGIGTVVIRDGVVQFSRHHYHGRSWECGNLGFDHYLNRGVVWINEGNYGLFAPSSECPGLMVTVKRGSLSPGRAGEGARIGVSKAGPYPHKGMPTQSVWHVAAVLHAGYGISGYQNSERAARGLPVMGWADGNYYEHMGEDGCYVSVAGDAVLPLTAYMATDLSNDGGAGGVYANVYNSGAMVNPVESVIQVYPSGGSGSRRFEPLMAPAKFGGVYIIFTSGSSIYIRYISPVGLLGKAEKICDGSKGSVAFDSSGNLHMAYIGSNGALKYRKVMMSTAVNISAQYLWNKKACQSVYDPVAGKWYVKTASDEMVAYGQAWGGGDAVPVSGDFDGDGYGDIAVWFNSSSKWYIYSPKLKTNLLWDFALGMPGTKPVSGDYDGDGKSDLAIYDQNNGKWYIMTLSKKVLAWGTQWGYGRARPVPGDYDGDKKWDLAVCDEDSGAWYINSLATGKNIMWGGKMGISNGVPVSGDFDGDKKYDLCMFDRIEAKWYIQKVDGTKITWGYQWGFKGGMPVGGDYDGDGAADIGVYDGLGVIKYGKWYIYSLKKSAAVIWDKDWGYRGTVPSGAAVGN